MLTFLFCFSHHTSSGLEVSYSEEDGLFDTEVIWWWQLRQLHHWKETRKGNAEGRTLLSIIIYIVCSKVNIWNASCARSTAFIFDPRKGCFFKCRSFRNRKCIDPRGTRIPNLPVHAECSNHFIYQGVIHLLSRVFEYWLWWLFWGSLN